MRKRFLLSVLTSLCLFGCGDDGSSANDVAVESSDDQEVPASCSSAQGEALSSGVVLSSGSQVSSSGVESSSALPMV